jgi:hypothetical protein
MSHLTFGCGTTKLIILSTCILGTIQAHGPFGCAECRKSIIRQNPAHTAIHFSWNVQESAHWHFCVASARLNQKSDNFDGNSGRAVGSSRSHSTCIISPPADSSGPTVTLSSDAVRVRCPPSVLQRYHLDLHAGEYLRRAWCRSQDT